VPKCLCNMAENKYRLIPEEELVPPIDTFNPERLAIVSNCLGEKHVSVFDTYFECEG